MSDDQDRAQARERLIYLLVQHQRHRIEGCLCGWGVDTGHMGESHPAHQLDQLLAQPGDLAAATGLARPEDVLYEAAAAMDAELADDTDFLRRRADRLAREFRAATDSHVTPEQHAAMREAAADLGARLRRGYAATDTGQEGDQ